MGMLIKATNAIASWGKGAWNYPWTDHTINRVARANAGPSTGNVSKGSRTPEQDQAAIFLRGDTAQGEDYYTEVCEGKDADPLVKFIRRFPTPPASHSIWCLMDKDPVIELTRGSLLGEILSVPRSYEARQGTPDKLVALVSAVFEPLMLGILSDAFEALSHKWQPFEVEWDERDVPNVGKAQVPVFFKPLLPELTEALMNKAGRLVGVRQRDLQTGDNIDLVGPKAFVFANEAPTGTPFGKSRHESCRARAWWPSIVCNWLGMLIDSRESGSVFHVKGPPNDQDGSKRIAQALTNGQSTYSSNFIATARPTAPNAQVQVNPQLAGTSAFDVEQFNLQSRAQAAAGILDKMRYYDSQKVRAWRKPERALLEGQFGTKAEAETHTESSRSDGEVFCLRFADVLNQWTIDELLVRYAGEKARGAVRVKFGSIVDRQKSWDERVMDASLANQESAAQVLNQVDLDAIYKRRGVPSLKDVITVAVKPPPDPIKLAKAGAVAKTPPGGAGKKKVTGGSKSSASSARNKGKQATKPVKS